MSASLPPARQASTWMEALHAKVESIRFGSVQLVIHDGRVTQIETTEKVRLAVGRDDHGPVIRRQPDDPS